MSNVKSLKRIVLAMTALSVLFPFAALSSLAKIDDSDKRSDRIAIPLVAEQGKEEMPVVEFRHDLHTQALDGQCAACHLEEKDAFVFKFKRNNEPASMELYHEACIKCHDEKKAAKKTYGPLAAECRACHLEKPAAGSSWVAIEFNKSLHYIHEKNKEIKSLDKADTNNCSACHHKANEKSKETFFAKGEEESCFYCHKDQDKDNTRSIRAASHDSCVKCHQSMKDKDITAGPVSCEGCHEAERQKEIKTVDNVPRLKRNQPDKVAITGWGTNAKNTTAFMKAVAFDHEFHESTAKSCKSCHHQTLKRCNDCHGADGGGQNGGFISLDKAMHSTDSSHSCVGCHKTETKRSDCAGCHSMMPAAKKSNPESCKKCHTLSPGELAGADTQMLLNREVTKRTGSYAKIAIDKIPEKVEIGILSEEYKPSVFPHRKVVEAIAARVETSRMANAFHVDQAGLCMGCHHNSPKTLEPPKCASCHSRNETGAQGKAGLKGAYHGQCIGCHQKMEIEAVAATDCIKCHEAKK